MPPSGADKAGTVRLSVGGQVIAVPWEHLLDPGRWFSKQSQALGPDIASKPRQK